jgi:TonB family protein
MSGFPRIFAIFRTTAETGFTRQCDKLRDVMSNDSPPGSSRPPAGGEFTWPPTSEELDSIEVIALEGSPPATTTSAATASVAMTSATTPSAFLAPELSTSLVVPAAARDVTRRPRPRLWMRRPSREDLVYAGVTLTSALAIAVAGAQQLSDWWRTPSQGQVVSDAPLTAAVRAATSPVANVALLQLLEKGPADVARPAVDATTPPVAAFADAASSIAPARTADARKRSASRVAPQPRHAEARRATSTRRAARAVAPRERRTSVSADAIASPPLRLPESYVQPRLVSQERGRRRGQVVLAVHVRPNGHVGDVEVLSGGDDRRHDDLERAAVSAVKQWRYRPALRDGVPTPARVKVVVNFS